MQFSRKHFPHNTDKACALHLMLAWNIFPFIIQTTVWLQRPLLFSTNGNTKHRHRLWHKHTGHTIWKVFSYTGYNALCLFEILFYKFYYFKINPWLS